MSEKPRNPNFAYKFSDALRQVLAVSKKTGNVTCEDGVKYSYDEIIRIEGNLTLESHRVKKLIGGEIVEYKKGSANGSCNNAHSEKEVASTAKTGAGDENGQLEIF